ncbi:hypothetical protein PF049_13135 [Erythrobacteraceae bacterium WH01K]|nr:hypothetical protein PF049_13135 [Erythrobacteraceae bacterium WH01K]
MKSLILSYAAASLTIATPVMASESYASLDFSGSRSLTTNWYGEDGIELKTKVCLFSSTGTFRLEIVGGAGMAALERDARQQIVLKTFDGQVQSAELGAAGTVIFTGRSPADSNCLGGEFAELSIEISERELGAATAGQYTDQLQFLIAPV